MGFFRKLLGITFKCPACGKDGAKETSTGTCCPNQGCNHYDAAYSAQYFAKGRRKQCKACRSDPATGSWICDSQTCGNYDQGYATRRAERMAKRRAKADLSNPVSIEYLNHRGESKSFQADPKTIKIRGQFISVQVAPHGDRISLRVEKITNRDAVLGQIGR